jgi:hypothetical protein
MSDDRLRWRQTADRLVQNARILHDVFLLNYRDEANRPKLQSGFEQEGFVIQKSLSGLMRITQLKPAVNTPNAEYNKFISAWDNGTGVLLSSFLRLNEFWGSLQTAQPELDRLITAQSGPQPTPGHRGTEADFSILTRLKSETNDLCLVYENCVNKRPASTQRIREHVSDIGELLRNNSLSQDAQTKLTNSKTHWAKFTTLYKNGLGIDWNSLSQLMDFKTYLNLDCIRVLGA